MLGQSHNPYSVHDNIQFWIEGAGGQSVRLTFYWQGLVEK
jgi:hypothetical protein